MSTFRAECPDPEALVAFADGVLDAGHSSVIAHLDECVQCRRALATVVDLDPTSGVGNTTALECPGPGIRLGRYALHQRIGAGAMGTVFAADDPTLDRSVAVKIVQADRMGSARAQRRLLAEARAMAQISHPNVVAVYDAGQCPWGVYIVMEQVVGQSLGAWWRDQSWNTIVGAFIDAGRGLAEAHDHGLIHRDFKPANVLVGRNGRAKVTDFGLVTGHPSSLEVSSNQPDIDPETASLDQVGWTANQCGSRLTSTGGTVGTPAYLAPERFRGAPATAASDQFAFCVALAQALYGQRPTVGTTFRELADNCAGAAQRIDPSASPAPRRLAEIVQRGLSCVIDDRFASMHAVVEALNDVVSRSQSRRLRLFTALGGLGLLAASATALSIELEARDAACMNLSAQVESAWSRSIWKEVEEHLRELGTSSGRRAAQRLPPLLDDYAEQWLSARTALCRQTLETDPRDEATRAAAVDAGIGCLDQRLADFEAAVTVLSDPQTTSAQAITIAGALQAPRRCLEARAGGAPSNSSTLVQADERRRLMGRIAEASTWTRLHRFEDALAAIEQEHQAIERLGDLHVRYNARLQRGILLAVLGRHEEGIDELEGLYIDAVESGHSEIATRAALSLVHALLDDASHTELAERWARAARSYADRAQSIHLQLAAANALSGVEAFRGRLEVAAKLARRGLAQAANASTDADPAVVSSLHHNLGNVALLRRDLEEAEREFGRELELLEARFGLQHPRTSEPLHGLIQVAVQRGQHTRAERLLERRAAALEDVADAQATDRSFELAMRSRIAEQRGDSGAALEYAAGAVESTIATKGEDNPSLLPWLNTHGWAALRAGEPATALASFVAATDLCRLLSEESHSCNGLHRFGVATARVALGDHVAALDDLRVAIAMLERQRGPDSAELALPLALMARTLLVLGRATEALGPARRAQVLVATRPDALDDIADVDFALAQTLVAADPSMAASEEAHSLARRAMAAYRALPRRQADADEVARWLGARVGRPSPAPRAG